MKSKQLKFLVGSVAILVALVYFGYQGFNESMSYFQTVPELYASGDQAFETSGVDISSMVDTWLLLRDVELAGERNRVMYILKSRGMAHSNQLREFLLTDRGIELTDVYRGPEGVLTGSMRLAQESREQAAALLRQQEGDRKRRELERKRQALEARITALRKELQSEEDEANQLAAQEKDREQTLADQRAAMSRSRKADAAGARDRPHKSSRGRQ